MSPIAPTRPLILASTSRYRTSLLQRFGLPFTPHNPGVDETERHGESPRARAFRLSEAKAEAVAAQFPEAIVIGGDQVPATSTTILNKPGNAANCREQLKLLSGSTAEFYTACTVRCLETGVKLSHVDTTAVKLRPLADTARDTLAWFKSRPAGRKLRGGLAPEKEAAVLKAWHEKKGTSGGATTGPATSPTGC